jgi:hypothetical protein
VDCSIAIDDGTSHARMVSDHLGRVPTNARASSHHVELSGSIVAGRSVSGVPGVSYPSVPKKGD